MRLAKTVLAFDMQARSVTMTAEGCPYTVVYELRKIGLRNVVYTDIRPVFNPASDIEIPDELECMLAEGEVLMRHIEHFLTCPTHAEMESVVMSQAHVSMQRAKVKFPHVTEMSLEGITVSLATGLSLFDVISTGMVQDHLTNKEVNEEEKQMLAQLGDGVSIPESYLDGVALNFEPLARPLTADDLEKLRRYDEELSKQRLARSAGPGAVAAAMATHPHGPH